MLLSCRAVKLQKGFVDYETSPDFPSAWGWRITTDLFRENLSFKIKGEHTHVLWKQLCDDVCCSLRGFVKSQKITLMMSDWCHRYKLGERRLWGRGLSTSQDHGWHYEQSFIICLPQVFQCGGVVKYRINHFQLILKGPLLTSVIHFVHEF